MPGSYRRVTSSRSVPVESIGLPSKVLPAERTVITWWPGRRGSISAAQPSAVKRIERASSPKMSSSGSRTYLVFRR